MYSYQITCIKLKQGHSKKILFHFRTKPDKDVIQTSKCVCYIPETNSK